MCTLIGRLGLPDPDPTFGRIAISPASGKIRSLTRGSTRYRIGHGALRHLSTGAYYGESTIPDPACLELCGESYHINYLIT